MRRIQVMANRVEAAERRAFANTGWLFADRIVRLGVGFAVGVWVARYLGPTRFGQLSYAIAFASLFGSFATLGTDDVIVRDIVRHPERADSILATGAAIRIAGTVAVTAIVLVAVVVTPFRESGTRILVLIFAVTFLVRPLEIADLWFQAHVNSRAVVIPRNVSFLLAAAAKLILVAFGSAVIGFVAVEPVVAAVSAGLILLAYRSYGRRFRVVGANLADARVLLRDSWPLLVGAIAITVYMRIDQVMLDALLGTAEVGIYSAAARLSESWYFIPTSIVVSVAPALVRARQASAATYHDRLQRLFSLMTAIALAVALPMTFLSVPLVRVVFGAQYASAGPILSVHVWSLLFVFWGVVGGAWVVNEGLTRLSMYRSIASAAVNVGLNFVLIPRYGGVGAAAATVVSQACGTWLLHMTDARTRPIFYMELRSLALKGILT